MKENQLAVCDVTGFKVGDKIKFSSNEVFVITAIQGTTILIRDPWYVKLWNWFLFFWGSIKAKWGLLWE